jgi:hypothetical protein
MKDCRKCHLPESQASNVVANGFSRALVLPVACSRPSDCGEIGRDFIEAHHLRPIATLEEGVPVKYDVAADFAVLCSNCHRMIHRFANPSDVQSFRASIL